MTRDPEQDWTIEVIPSLDGVETGQWDALTPQDPMASHGWLRVFEDEVDDRVETSYLLVRRDQQLVAGLPCYLCHRKTGLMDPDQLMFGRFRQLPESLRLSFVPTMLVGPLRSYGPKILLSRALNPADSELAAKRLLEAADDLARSAGLSVQVPKISARHAETLQVLAMQKYHLTHDFPIAFLDIEWSDFDGYLNQIKSFSPKMRRNIKEEMNRFRRSGVQIRELRNPADHQAALLQIAHDHYWRLNESALPYSGDYLVNLKRRLGSEVVIYGALLDERLIGFVLMLVRGATGYLPMTGIDRRWTGNEATYFNLCYYRPIQDAIDKGLTRIYYGTTLHHPKVRRGCQLLGMRHAYRGASRSRHAILGPWFAFHAAWMKRRNSPLENLPELRRGSHG